MFGSLFIRVKDAPGLETFSKKIFALMNVEIKEIRYSDNAPRGRYIYGEVLGLRVTLTEADAMDFPDYHFLLSFRPQIGWPTADRYCLDGLADVLAKFLARNDMEIARSLEDGKTGTARVEYNGETS
jgi:hypothetical protein